MFRLRVSTAAEPVFLSIKSSKDDDKDVFGIYLFDTGTDAKGGGYEPFDTKLSSGTKRQETHLRKKTETIFPLLYFSTFLCLNITMY